MIVAFRASRRCVCELRQLLGWSGTSFMASQISRLPQHLLAAGKLFLVPVVSMIAFSSLMAAAGPPTGENAYCGKGNVAHFGDKDGPAQLPTACYYTGLDGTPSP